MILWGAGWRDVEVQHLLPHAQLLVERDGRRVAVVGLHEHDPSAALRREPAQAADERRREEGQKLLARKDGTGAIILLDERGRDLGSEEFARALAGYAAIGRKSLTIAIGGPDGHDAALRDNADLVLSFGKLTWPHQLVRVMLAEQLYRAATILSGHPYHRA